MVYKKIQKGTQPFYIFSSFYKFLSDKLKSCHRVRLYRREFDIDVSKQLFQYYKIFLFIPPCFLCQCSDKAHFNDNLVNFMKKSFHLMTLLKSLVLMSNLKKFRNHLRFLIAQSKPPVCKFIMVTFRA